MQSVKSLETTFDPCSISKVPPHSQPTVRGCVGQWLSNKSDNAKDSYARALRYWIDFLEGDWGRVLSVGIPHVKAFLLHLQTRRNLSRSTTALTMRIVRKFHDELLACGLVDSNPFRSEVAKLPRGAADPENPTAGMDEGGAYRLLKSIDRNDIRGKRDYAILCVLLGGGVRRSELLKLTLADISDRDRLLCLTLRRTKNRAHHQVLLPAWASEGLRHYLPYVGGDKVFCVSLTGLRHLFRERLRAVGMSGYSPHSCRVTAINKLLDGNYSAREVMAFSGHKSLRSLDSYQRRLSDIKKNPGRTIRYDKEEEMGKTFSRVEIVLFDMKGQRYVLNTTETMTPAEVIQFVGKELGKITQPQDWTGREAEKEVQDLSKATL